MGEWRRTEGMSPLRSAAVLSFLAIGLVACGSDDDMGSASSEVATTIAPAPVETNAAPESTTVPAAGASVTIKTFQFGPDPLVVAAGTTITFLNEDKIDHTVTAGTREAPMLDVFNGVLPEQGATFELTLDEPGTYDYFCQIHPGPGMTAVITVE